MDDVDYWAAVKETEAVAAAARAKARTAAEAAFTAQAEADAAVRAAADARRLAERPAARVARTYIDRDPDLRGAVHVWQRWLEGAEAREKAQTQEKTQGAWGRKAKKTYDLPQESAPYRALCARMWEEVRALCLPAAVLACMAPPCWLQGIREEGCEVHRAMETTHNRTLWSGSANQIADTLAFLYVTGMHGVGAYDRDHAQAWPADVCFLPPTVRAFVLAHAASAVVSWNDGSFDSGTTKIDKLAATRRFFVEAIGGGAVGGPDGGAGGGSDGGIGENWHALFAQPLTGGFTRSWDGSRTKPRHTGFRNPCGALPGAAFDTARADTLQLMLDVALPHPSRMSPREKAMCATPWRQRLERALTGAYVPTASCLVGASPVEGMVRTCIPYLRTHWAEGTYGAPSPLLHLVADHGVTLWDLCEFKTGAGAADARHVVQRRSGASMWLAPRASVPPCFSRTPGHLSVEFGSTLAMVRSGFATPGDLGLLVQGDVGVRVCCDYKYVGYLDTCTIGPADAVAYPQLHDALRVAGWRRRLGAVAAWVRVHRMHRPSAAT